FLELEEFLEFEDEEKLVDLDSSREASRKADSKHLRPLICAEEAAEFHKRVNRIHDLVKIVVPCDVFAAESPIPPDRSVHLDSY
ncbi:hypothetical protein HID58_042944, partial [Brassica napus]